MENDPPLQPAPAPSKKAPNKWLRLGRKILIGAVITWCINFLLLKTGWDSWATFSKQADTFSASMVDGALRLSPINLWNSIKADQKTYAIDNSSSPYFPSYIETGKLTLKDKVLIWLGYYWYTQEGKAFWVGRIILILAVVVAIGSAKEEFPDKAGTMEFIIFPFKVIGRTLLYLVVLGFITLLLYVLAKILLAIVGGLVVIFSTIAAGGGITKLVLDEAKNEAADSSKKTIAASLLPLLFGKSRKK